MLTAEGCRQRRQRLWERLTPKPKNDFLLLADPIHLRYFANFYVDPFSYSADFGGILLVKPDGSAKLFHDHRTQSYAKLAHVEETETIPWYDGIKAGHGPRRFVLHEAVQKHGGHIHDCLCDPLSPTVYAAIAQMRRQKDPDEVELLRKCMRANEAGQKWARENVQAGLTELQVYTGIAKTCSEAAGQAVVVYGDFAVSPGPSRKGGPPTNQVLKEGDMMILDYSVIIGGYRSDFTNTLVVGGKPTADQKKLYDGCMAAMAAGEKAMKAGVTCLAVYQAVKDAFAAVGLAEHFPHHAGHGLGLSHPEAPFFVKEASETLMEGDVMTLEPGLYIDGIGGIRIEHNYLVTASGYDRLSNHEITLV